MSAVDVLARRTRLAFVDMDKATAAVPRVVEIMGDALGWSSAKRAEEKAKAAEFLATMKGCPGSGNSGAADAGAAADGEEGGKSEKE